jgi:iron complex transport system substrate-binding protein
MLARMLRIRVIRKNVEIPILLLVLLTTSFIAGKITKYRIDLIKKEIDAAQGSRISFLYKPNRIVSVDYRSDEILMDLVQHARILALSPDADNPSLSNIIEQARLIKGRVDLNTEKILMLEPDLVIVGPSGSPDTVSLLKQSGIRVVRLKEANTREQIERNITELGRLVNEEERAKQIVLEMSRKLAAIQQKRNNSVHSRVLYIGTNGSYTAGIGTYIDELIGIIGAVNLAREAGIKGWGSISIENVIAMNPEIIFLPDTGGTKRTLEIIPTPDFTNDPAWRDVEAVKSGRVYKLPASYMLCVSQHSVKAAEAMANVLYQPKAMARHGERFK